jgi:hypothetical protein
LTITKHKAHAAPQGFHIISGPTSTTSLTALTNDDLHLYAAYDSGMITMWEKPTLDVSMQVPSGSSAYIQSLLVDDRYLYGGTLWNDCSIKVFDKQSLELKHSLQGSQGTIFVLSSRNRFLFSGTGDSRVIIWDKDDWSEHGSVSGQKHFVLSLAVDNQYIYAGGIDDCTNVIARDDLSQVTALKGHESNVLSLACDEKYLYSGSGEIWWGGPGSPRPPKFESAVRVWDKNDWDCIAVLDGHTDNVNAICTDSDFVYSISDDSTFRVYFKKNWSEVLCLEVDVTRIDTMTSHKKFVYIGCSDGSVRQFSKRYLES